MISLMDAPVPISLSDLEVPSACSQSDSPEQTPSPLIDLVDILNDYRSLAGTIHATIHPFQRGFRSTIIDETYLIEELDKKLDL